MEATGMVCAACDQEITDTDNLAVIHSPEADLGDALLGIIILCQPCKQEVLDKLSPLGVVLDTATGELSMITRPEG